MKIKIIAIAVTLLLYIAGNAQKTITQTIRGKVIDKESQETLPGANVIILGTEPLLGTSTDIDGTFRIDDVPIGRYNIKISFMGYDPIILPEVMVGSGKEIVLNVGIQESVQKMDEVVVKAKINKHQAQNSMATLSARTFSVEETRRYAGGFDDPARMAASFAGVAVGNVQDNAIVIRGNAPKGVLWKLEGVEIPNPNHFAGANVEGGGAFTLFSGQMMSNSDFYTGAFPAEYGNALSGVFDMKLRVGNNQKYEHTFQAGVLGVEFASEGPLSKKKNASYLFNYRYSTFGIIKNIMNTEQIPEYQDLSYKLNFPTKKAGTFSLWGIGGLDKVSEPSTTDTSEWEVDWDRIEYDATFQIGAAGLSHKYRIGTKSLLQTSLATSVNNSTYDSRYGQFDMTFNDFEYADMKNGKHTFTTNLNHKFNARHTNRTGILYNYYYYDMIFDYSSDKVSPQINIVDDRNHAQMIEAYTQSKYNLGKNTVLNAGIHAQYFDISNKLSIEPRASIKYSLPNNQSICVGYGNHSQNELLRLYTTKIYNEDGSVSQPNKNLDFAKAHHLVLAYDKQLTEHLRLKIEPYFQYLYNVPIIEDSTFSMINFEQDWFIDDKFVNDGIGINYGLDVTLERFLKNNFYYLLTASVFDSKYSNDNGKTYYDTRFNRNYVFNVLAGKEWFLGKEDNKVLGVNGKFIVKGGNKTNKIDVDASHAARNIVYDNSKPFTRTLPSPPVLDLTVTYRINKAKYSSVWALQLKNAFASKDNYFDEYNLKSNTIMKNQGEAIVLPIVSYKVEF